MIKTVQADNTIYKRQLAVLAMMLSITFKLVMLPSYYYKEAGRDSWIGMAIMTAVEIVMFSLVYFVISRTNITRGGMPKWITLPLFALLFVSSGIKMTVLLSESVDYIANVLFDEINWLFVVAIIAPVIAYVGYKGPNTIVRLAEIGFWIVLGTVLFVLIFFKAESDIMRVTPVLEDGFGGIASAIDKHYLWFGDFTPLLFLYLSRDGKGKIEKASVPLSLIFIYMVTVGFFILFAAIYGNVGQYVSHAFSNISVFNKISDMLGGMHFPIIIAWLIMAVIKFAFLLYAMIECVKGFLPDKIRGKSGGYIAAAIMFSMVFIVVFGVQSLERSYDFATGWVRYVAAVIEYAVPIFMFIAVGVKYAKADNK